MLKVFIFAVFGICAAFTYPTSNADFEVLETEEGLFYLVPIETKEPVNNYQYRPKRQTSGSIGSNGVGVSHTGIILNNPNHRLDGTAFAHKNFGGPITAGGSLDYLHKPTRSELSLNAARTPGFGTDVGVRGSYNFLEANKGRTTGSLSGEYGRHFGGPGGTGRPNYGAFLNFQHRF